MKYLLFTLFFISTMSSACIIGPQNIKPRPELGFDFKESDSDLCVNCSMISINSPKVYDGRPVSHAVISIFQNGEVVFKSVFAFEKELFSFNKSIKFLFSLILKSFFLDHL